MVNVIKFCGRNKIESKKKAMTFYYDNYEDELSRKVFLAKCRLQPDGKTIHFYPDLEVDMTKLGAERKNKGTE